MLGECDAPLDGLGAALLPSTRPNTLDQAVFAIDPSDLEPGQAWDADPRLLTEQAQDTDLPLPVLRAFSGRLEVERHERCGVQPGASREDVRSVRLQITRQVNAKGDNVVFEEVMDGGPEPVAQR